MSLIFQVWVLSFYAIYDKKSKKLYSHLNDPY